MDAVIRWENSVALRDALCAIPDDNRRALIMHLWGRCAYQEISDKLGLSLSAVASRIRRAKLQLRDLLGSPEVAPPARSHHEEGTHMAATARQHRRPLLVPQLGHTGQVLRISVSPDGRRLASTDNTGSLIVRDIETGRQELRLSEHGWPGNVSFSPDSHRLAFPGQDSKAVVYDVEQGTRLLSLRAEGTPLAFTPDGEHLWTSWWTPDPENRDWTQTNLFCWHLESRRVVRRIENLAGQAALLSPDQTRFVTLAGKPILERRLWLGMEDVELIVWDLATREPVSRLRGLDGVITEYAISPDGRLLASSSWSNKTDRGVRVWDVETGELLHKLIGHEETVGAIAFTPDSSVLVTASLEGVIICWDPRTGQEQRRIANNGRIDSLAFTPDGRRLFTPGTDGKPGTYVPRIIREWDWESAREVRCHVGHGCWMTAGEFSPDGRIFAAAGGFPALVQWNCETGALDAAFPLHPGSGAHALSYSPSGANLISADIRYEAGELGREPTRQVTLWETGNPESPTALTERLGVDAFVGAVAWSPDGRYAAVRSHVSIVIADTSTWQKVREIRHPEWWMGMPVAAFTPDSRGVASILTKMSPDHRAECGAAVIWDVETGEEIRRWDDVQGYETLCLSRDGGWIAIGMAYPLPGDDRIFQMRLHDVKTGELLREFVLPPAHGRVMSMTFSPDGSLLAAGNHDGTVFLWDPDSGRLLASLHGRAGCIAALDFSPDGLLLAAGGRDGTIVIWRVADVLKSRTPREAVRLVAIDDGSQWLAYTPRGYYDCSPGAEKYLLWRMGNEFHGPDVFARRFHRPDAIRRALAA